MLKTLERYQKFSYGAVEVNRPAKELESSCKEYLKLIGRCEVLQKIQRNLLGEDLGSLNNKDLEQLECQLDSTLKQVGSTKRFYREKVNGIGAVKEQQGHTWCYVFALKELQVRVNSFLSFA